MKEPKYLLWVDLETTGTDEKRDPIIEVGWIVTTPTLHPLIERSLPSRPNCWRHAHDLWDEAGIHSGRSNPADPDNWPEVVHDMHTNNGLISEIDADLGWALADVEAEVIKTLELYGKKHDFMLAGSGVSHFDRRFIQAQMPKLEKWLQYPNLDVGVLRRAWQLWSTPGTYYPDDDNRKTHRALDDIRMHLSEANFWCGLIREAAKRGET